MTPSDQIIEFIKGYETCRLQAFLPTPDDVPTIGWGATGPDVRLGMRWTQQQADERFACDLQRYSAAVDSAVSGAATTQGQFDAMVSLAYNVGEAGFRGSSVLRYHLRGETVRAANAFALWNRQAGRTLGGLTRRRAAEARIYAGQA